MTCIKTEDTSFKTFQDMLNGYRLTEVCKVAHESDVFNHIGEEGADGILVCERAGWDKRNGLRFLDALSGLGLLITEDGFYSLTAFSKKFFLKTSDYSQVAALSFENRLVESWSLLKETLVKGERVFSTADKTGEAYETALDLYLRAMDDAAKIRAVETWDSVNPGGNGVILDVGAGSGAFLTEFMTRHSSWQGVFCDLKDVVEKAKQNKGINAFKHRLSFIGSNLLEDKIKTGGIFPNIIMLSNLIHCQGKAETKTVLENSLHLLPDDGIVIIHDFFTDCGWRGGLYDIHMMLNTYNGRTYTIDAVTDMLTDLGILYSKIIRLKSGSTLLIAAKQPVLDEFTL